MSAGGREPIRIACDLSTMTVRIGVLPSPFALEDARVWQAISIPELQDHVATITVAYNQYCRESAGKVRTIAAAARA